MMSIALLVYAATEYQVRKVMKEHNLSIPTHDEKPLQKRPTFDRLNQYLANAKITLIVDNSNGNISIDMVD